MNSRTHSQRTPGAAAPKKKGTPPRELTPAPRLKGTATDGAVSIFVGFADTRAGRVFIATTESAVVAASLPGEVAKTFQARAAESVANCKIVAGTTPMLERALAQVRDFFLGRRDSFDLPVEPRVSPFARRVLDGLARVPFGKTLTYGELAERIGAPRASRAVGTALAKNPIPIILPCHRVIAAGGALGGFAGKARAVGVKRELLELEGVRIC